MLEDGFDVEEEEELDWGFVLLEELDELELEELDELDELSCPDKDSGVEDGSGNSPLMISEPEL